MQVLVQDAHHPSHRTGAGMDPDSRDEDLQAFTLLAEVVDKLQRFMVSSKQLSATPRLSEKIPLRSSATFLPPTPYPCPISSSSSSSSSYTSREATFSGPHQTSRRAEKTAVRFDCAHRTPGSRRQECERLSGRSSSGEALEEQQDCGSPGCLSSRRRRNM